MTIPGINLKAKVPALPKERSKARSNSPRVLTLYGQPKVGKTTSLAALDDCLILNLDPRGTDHIEARAVDIENLDVFMSLIAQLQGAQERPRYIAIDHVGILEDWCLDWATRLYKLTIPGKNFTGDSVLELPMGAGYGKLRERINMALACTLEAADRVIFVCHVRDRMLTKNQKEVLAMDLDLTGKIRNIVCAMSDAIGYMYRDDARPTELKISFMTRETVNCGSRCPHLAGKVLTFSEGPTEFKWGDIYVD